MHLCACAADLFKERAYTVTSLLLLSLRKNKPAFHNPPPHLKEMSIMKIMCELFITFGITSQFSNGFGKNYIFREIQIPFARVTLFQTIHLTPHRIQ